MALLFDGVDDKVRTTNAIGWGLSYPLALAMFCRLPALPGGDVALASLGLYTPSNAGWVWELSSAGLMDFVEISDLSYDRVTSVGAVPATTWVLLGYVGTNITSHRLYCYNYETKAE